MSVRAHGPARLLVYLLYAEDAAVTRDFAVSVAILSGVATYENRST